MNDALAEELVGMCMGYVVHIKEARDLLWMTQPSEPILAFVAAERMKKPSTRLNVASCFQGTVNVGNLDEIVASLLLLSACDEVQFHHAPRSLPAPIKVSCFMGSLFGNKWHAEMAKRMALDPEMKTRGKRVRSFSITLPELKGCPMKR